MALAELVDWAENVLMEGEFAEDEAATLSAVVARLGVADVRAFGLTWADCEQLLGQLGFSARVDIVAAWASSGSTRI
jgi:hypothetical protein